MWPASFEGCPCFDWIFERGVNPNPNPDPNPNPNQSTDGVDNIDYADDEEDDDEDVGSADRKAKLEVPHAAAEEWPPPPSSSRAPARSQ